MEAGSPQTRITAGVAVVLLAGLLLTSVVSNYIHVRERAARVEAVRGDVEALRERFTRFEYSTRLYEEAIRNRVAELRERLSGVRELFSTQDTVGWEVFEEFVAPIHDRYPEVSGLFWIPRIKGSDAQRLERAEEKEAPPGFRLRFDVDQERSSSGDVWPVHFAAPVRSNRSWLGLNARNHEILRRVVRDDTDRSSPWLTDAFSAEGEHWPEDVFLVMHLRGGGQLPSGTSDGPVEYLSGFVAALIHAPALLEAATADPEAEPVRLFLYDGADQLIATSGPVTEEERRAGDSAEQMEETLEDKVHVVREIEVVGEQDWRVILVPAQSIGIDVPRTRPSAAGAWLVVIFGALISILAAGLTYRLMAENYRRRVAEEQQRQLSQRDSLTELLNRRALDEALEKEWSRFSRTGETLSVLVLDLDHFKQVNDTYGHAAGDEVLKLTGRVLRDADRRSDTAYRYGGEEFCVVLPETGIEEAVAVAQRIRTELGSRPVTVGNGQAKREVRVTCSVGVASVTETDQTPGEMLQRADAALYAAKRKGRNRVDTAHRPGPL